MKPTKNEAKTLPLHFICESYIWPQFRQWILERAITADGLIMATDSRLDEWRAVAVDIFVEEKGMTPAEYYRNYREQ